MQHYKLAGYGNPPLIDPKILNDNPHGNFAALIAGTPGTAPSMTGCAAIRRIIPMRVRIG